MNTFKKLLSYILTLIFAGCFAMIASTTKYPSVAIAAVIFAGLFFLIGLNIATDDDHVCKNGDAYFPEEVFYTLRGCSFDNVNIHLTPKGSIILENNHFEKEGFTFGGDINRTFKQKIKTEEKKLKDVTFTDNTYFEARGKNDLVEITKKDFIAKNPNIFPKVEKKRLKGVK